MATYKLSIFLLSSSDRLRLPIAFSNCYFLVLMISVPLNSSKHNYSFVCFHNFSALSKTLFGLQWGNRLKLFR